MERWREGEINLRLTDLVWSGDSIVRVAGCLEVVPEARSGQLPNTAVGHCYVSCVLVQMFIPARARSGRVIRAEIPNCGDSEREQLCVGDIAIAG